ncbi:bile acid:sodium symporter family protein [Sphingomonas turrisvirgatae]|uniref:Bile acid:sodium symporter n=1 Tax=Sphingomonas turrisvirgatae TaxID=1888892 RepID=A0A1E3LVH0_9SPHN|nr:bile acid:sodium symporter family protein [Sphingomonas turrisvirgatae]ODP37748.1 bile acid:sodium symporter [Sphingomonas turrisvirgatae]
MLRRVIGFFEPFVLALLGTVLLASLLPVRGAAVPMFGGLTDAGIVLLFFLHGAKLPREAIVAGFAQWRLHLLVLGVTFGLFPLFGIAFSHLPLLPASLATGMLFLTLLPSTVQSSIAFTAMARGNVPAAVCTAAFSNLAGIFATPLLVALLIGDGNGGVTINTASIKLIVMQLLVPFLLGHALRPLVGGFVARQKRLVTLVDRGSILLVVYTAFSAAVVEDLWSKVSGTTLIVLIVCCCTLFLLVWCSTLLLARWAGLSREDMVVLQFCGSKKSLASGVPMAGVLFPVAQVGMMILPLMLFHQIQLLICAVLARHYARQPLEPVDA